MQNYDFKNLNDKEFEVLVNDLLSKREVVAVDRFKAGKDGGIDGRFFTAGNAEIIIQSKHWIKSGIKPLIRRLKKEEVPKVKKLNPKRYIIATSLELSNADKQKIKFAFEPYIISEDDILGQENLNDMLSKHADIEKKHYKLWLSSSNVLSAMLNTALTGRSEAMRDKIISATQMYIVTDNHDRALKKLEELYSVVITGEAGIGKTSLADQLAHHYVGHGFELCVIENDISEAERIFEKDKKQVFYFDDFLGRNFLMAIEGRKDSHVLNFIDRISKDRSKRFILTSRSTVLKQGKKISDLLSIKKIDQKEYEIIIQSLSNLDRAKILYNHIRHGNLEDEYIEEIYIDKRYTKIAKHKNYNPRIIQFITDAERFKDVSPEQYWDHLIKKLDNPQDIWAEVFDEQIDELTRIAVCLVVFNGTSMEEDELQESFSEATIDNGLATVINAHSKYIGMLKIAVGSMLQRTLMGDLTLINLFNPSVADFVLGRYLKNTQSLNVYFSCLNALYSLHNLKSLRKNGKLKDSSYYEIVRNLAVKKINANFLENKTSYFLALTNIIVTDPKAVYSENIPTILENIQNINSITIPEGYIEETCNILKFAISQKPQKFKMTLKSFIIKASQESLTHDELVLLDGLIETLPDLNEDEEIELRNLVKVGIETYWDEEIYQAIADDNVLDEYIHEEQEHEAFDSLHDYLHNKLYDLGLPEEKIYSIARSVDIADILNENMIAASRARGHYTGGGSSRSVYSANDDALIDDLFQKE